VANNWKQELESDSLCSGQPNDSWDEADEAQGIRSNGGRPIEPFNYRHLWLQIAILTAVLELLTIGLRFGLKLESTRDTASTIGRVTLGVRIHHGYCGALLIVVAWGLSQTHSKITKVGYVLGWSLLFSDAIHHFVVLRAITGSPQFDLLYPP
jgi:hypothetical protein